MTDLGLILDRLGLGQYLEKFFEEGFEAWETVLDITESDLIKGNTGVILRLVTRGPRLPTPVVCFDQDQLDVEADIGDIDRRMIMLRIDLNLHMSSFPTIRDDLKSENLSFTDIAKRVGELWQALSPEEKKPFETQAGSAKEEYLADLAHYKTTDNFKEYTHYLADFKAKHPPKPDDKKLKHETYNSPTSSESVGRQRDSTEPRHDSVSQEPDQSIMREVHGHRSNHSFAKPRGSPSASVSPVLSSGPAAKLTSPSLQYTPQQLPLERGSLERNVTTCPSPLPPLATFDARETPLTQGSTVWFNSRPGTAPSTKSPLSNYRRSHHPPPSFIDQNSTSSSKSTSQSVDSAEITMGSNKPREGSRLYHKTPASSRGSEEQQHPADKTDGTEPSSSRALHEPQIRSVSNQVPPENGIPSSPSRRLVNPSAHAHPAVPHRLPSVPKTLPRKRKEIEPDGDGLLGGSSPPPVDPLSVLAYAGGIMDRQSRGTC
ncbi:MAG: hypothetical protein Q9216_000356 [Gyalolechia sp. 2 TL-2023]